MVTRSLRAGVVVSLAVLTALGAAACDKMPLVAPTGTIITLFANSTVLPVNGSIEITAVAIEGGAASTGTGTTTGSTGSTGATASPGQGTPVHNGTVISFTTTLGRIEPQEARSHNGQVTVRLYADGASGVATVRAFSGGASSNELKLSVGAAAAKTVILSASPQTLNSTGGSATITARVLDPNGTTLPGVPVTFTADNGTLSQSTVITDATGTATTTLSTSRETKVTATVSGDVKADVTVKVNARIGITITPPSTSPTAGVAAAFTVAVASTANVQNVRVNWGDGASTDLGAVSGSNTVSHTYRSDGNFTVTATANDASGESASVSTAVTVLPQQPPTVDITVSPTAPRVNDTVRVTARVSGNTTSIQRYIFDFNDGPSSVLTGTSNTASYVYRTAAARTITVTVEQASGPVGQAQAFINVTTTLR